MAELGDRTAKEGGAYHHGDLRRALVAAGRATLERDGLDKLSLRGAARAAGVSQSAPYHHFADKTALLSAIAADGFRDFGAAMQTRMGAGATPRDRLIGAGVAYVRFAHDNPALFRLMFSAHGWSEDEERAAAGDAAYRAFENAMRASMQARGDTENADIRCLAAWSQVHGLAKLVVELGVTPVEYGCGTLEELAEKVLTSASATEPS